MHIRKDLWLYLGILSLGITSLFMQLEEPITEIISRKPNHRELRIERPRYQVYKFTKYLTLKDYVLLHRIFLDKKHMSIFTCILNGMKTIQIVMQHGLITQITGKGIVAEQTVLRTEPGLVVFSVPGLKFSMKFQVTERVELVLDGKKYTNVVCICRYYFK